MSEPHRVALLGDGLVAETISGLLEQVATVETIDTAAGVELAGELAGFGAVVVARDGWETLGHEVIQHAAVLAGVPCLPVRVELGTAIIGPTAVPGVPGCLSCAAVRHAAAHEDEDWLAQVPARFPDNAFTPAPLLTRATAGVIARIVTTEVALTVAGRSAARTDRRVVRLRLDTLAVRTHRFLPVAGCWHCGGTPADSAQLAEIELRSRPKPARNRHRLHDLVRDELYDTYLDAELGLTRELTKIVPGSFPAAAASVGLLGRSGNSGYGRALDFQSAQLTAIAEGVERLAGVRPGAKRTILCGTYRELAKYAVNPVDLGLYPDDWYYQPGFPYCRYTPDATTKWVWGYSFGRTAPVLVPEAHAYYGLDDDDASAPFACETSNGCALGSCLEEAILHGLLELVERDAFLMTWYTRRPARLLDLSTATDRTIPLMVERIRHDHGHQVLAYDITMEHGIPAVWTMLVHPSNDGTDVKVRCTAGAGFDPERALVNALLELVTGLEWQRATFMSEMDRIERMVDDSDQVRTMPDHALLYSHPKAFRRLSFLTDSQPPVPIVESFAGALQATSTDLTDDLNAVVARFIKRGQDVIVVDQTTPDQRAGGFACIKVLIPGLVPMTFGHRNRRLAGLPRLFSAPVELGYARRPMRPEDLNPHPHPFP